MPRPYHLFKYNHREGDDFTIIAHRGASAYYPENTLPSFEGAIAMGADMAEFDVQLSSDKEVVVFHDEKISRCTDGRGKISDYTLAQLKKLDAGSWYNKDFKDTSIPTLAEVLDICKNKIAVNIEIKTEAVSKMFFGGIEEKCLKIVEQSGMNGHVVFSSFDPRAIMHLKQIDTTVTVAVLYEKKHYGSKLPSDIMDSLGADVFNCSRSDFKKKWLINTKLNNIPVNIYTVNDAKNMKRFINMGVSGIFTNNPDILKRVAADVKKKQENEGRKR
ncbi:MAG: glycerophosphodiester phosphodiesterase family protein [Deltaproteobacteria bacterium]|nr:glycerophosphodiester phosphodiesterase family protein [Deltaproteobacteria bacterium]